MKRIIRVPDPDQEWEHDFSAPLDGKPRFVNRVLETQRNLAKPRVGPGHSSPLTNAQARRIHAEYQDGLTLREVAALHFEQIGYCSADSCERALRTAWKRLGLKSRKPGGSNRSAVQNTAHG